jgi:dTDP-4-dehydrorhamnose 3,5-epimerase
MNFITLKNISKTKLIEDIVVRPLKVNRDESGILIETLRTDWKDVAGPGREFEMQYYSVTDSCVARDEDVWHYHPTGQEDRFIVTQGRIITAIADNREDSETKGLLNLFIMDAIEDPYLLLVPKKTLHGFMVVSEGPATLLNFPTRLYDPKEEGRIQYQEAKVKIENGELFAWDKVRKRLGLNKK